MSGTILASVYIVDLRFFEVNLLLISLTGTLNYLKYRVG
jgi:hypothetical protein